jgi:hypothetical protein
MASSMIDMFCHDLRHIDTAKSVRSFIPNTVYIEHEK